MAEDVHRRHFLKLSGGITAGVAAGASSAIAERAAPAVRVTSLKDVKPLEPVTFSYPDDSFAVLVDLGRSVPNGVGPKKSIVAFSGLCQHMGCPVDFNAARERFVCPCHASEFDPAREGNAVEGPSTRGLPRIALKISQDGTVSATGVASGLVYGRACNND